MKNHNPTGLLVIVARRVRWPDLAARPNRSGLRLRWDALTEAGELLVAATEHPLTDGAHVLVRRGFEPETPVTLRHEGADHDSFKPMPLRIPAARGAKRAEATARIAAHSVRGSQETAATASSEPMDRRHEHRLPLPAIIGAFTDRRAAG